MKIEPTAILQRPPFTVHCFSSLPSTNDFLKIQTDAPEFTCVIADEQTAGRGRRTRTWVSTPGDGLYLSLLLRPPASANIALLSLLAAVAVAETLVQYNVAKLDIKWPNDVLLGERKVCGILVEGVSSGGQALRVILGIGVNLNHQHLPPEIRETATSLALHLGHAVDAAEFRNRLLSQLTLWYSRWQHDGGRSVLERWQQLSSYAHGQNVAVTLDDEHVIGTTAGLTKDGALLLQLADGALRALLVGEVSKLRKGL
jgi:BirA family transcriptional regulator, biotin operon repressor / biotin---[acetyl-CoA-carboxylase] ligase